MRYSLVAHIEFGDIDRKAPMTCVMLAFLELAFTWR